MNRIELFNDSMRIQIAVATRVLTPRLSMSGFYPVLTQSTSLPTLHPMISISAGNRIREYSVMTDTTS